MKALALSGPLSAGKSTVAAALAHQRSWRRVTAREILMAHAGRSLDRVELQVIGRQLEDETHGRWLADGVAAEAAASSDVVWVVDSGRTASQIDALRRLFDDDLVLVHVSAAYEVRRARFRDRKLQDPVDDNIDFDEVSRDELEVASEALRMHADFVIDTTYVPADTVAKAVLLLARAYVR